MKLRQKLAAVLAATMIVSSVPVVTMAASDNALTKGVMVQEKDASVQAGSVKVTMKDTVDGTGAMFFVNLKNAEWTSTTTTTGSSNGVDFEYKVNSKSELQVSVKASGVDAKTELLIPLDVKLTGGDATVAIDGNGTVVSDMAPVVFARTSEAKANVTAADSVAVYDNGTVASVSVEEALKGSLTTAADDDRIIELTLENTEFEFTTTNAGIKLSKGFSSIDPTTIDVQYGQDSQGNIDKQLLKVKMPAVAAASLTAPGRIEFAGLQVKAKKPTAGVINIEVSGNKVNTTSVKVADVKTYGNIIEMKDQKPVEIVAGKQDKVTFTIKETVNDSILAGRQAEVKFDKAYLSKTNASGQTLVPTVKLNDVTLSAGDVAAMNIQPVTNDDDYITGFTFTTPSLHPTDADKLTFVDMPVFVPLTASGDVTVSAEGRALAQEVSTTAVKAKAPVEITTEAMTLKVGLKDQKGGKITIKEADKGMLAVKDLEIALPSESGLTFSSTKPVVKVVSGDLQLGDSKIVGNKLIVAVKRASKTASTVEISDLVVSTDRTLPQGSYDVVVKGETFVSASDAFVDASVTPSVLNDDMNTIKVKDFIVIGTPNTEDIASNGLKKGIATFAIGDKNYTINGVKQVMDGAPYVNNGRTMVPVRYVANALGVDAKDIFFANGTVTIIAGSKTITLEMGNKVAKLNGAPARVMTAAPVVKDGRTYVPVSEIGALLGVNASWDGVAKVATFENK